MTTVCALFSLVVVVTLYLPIGRSFAQPIDATLIYSPDPVDTWNRLFSHLFSRTIRHRVTEAFPEGAPFSTMALMGSREGVSLSNRIFERFESGDRAIDIRAREVANRKANQDDFKRLQSHGSRSQARSMISFDEVRDRT